MQINNMIYMVLLFKVLPLFGMCLIDEHPEIALRMIENEQSLLRMRKLQLSVQAMPKIHKVLSHEAVVAESPECSVCMEEYSQERRLVKLLCDPPRNISHEFCSVCIADWQKVENSCPTCRRPIAAPHASVYALFNFSRILEFFSCGNCSLEQPEE